MIFYRHWKMSVCKMKWSFHWGSKKKKFATKCTFMWWFFKNQRGLLHPSTRATVYHRPKPYVYFQATTKMAPYIILNNNDGSLGVLGEEADLSVCFLGGGKAHSANSTSVRERNDGRMQETPGSFRWARQGWGSCLLQPEVSTRVTTPCTASSFINAAAIWGTEPS